MQYALITGGGGGLGFELVKEHLDAGYTVFALDVDVSAHLQNLAFQHPEKLYALKCDIGSTFSVTATMKTVLEKTTVLHRIFNNAGIHRFEDWVTLDETDLDFLSYIYNINAVGPLRILKAALPLLNSDSIVVNTSSEAASLTNQTSTIGYAYAMSKAGMNMGARIADNWLSEKGVRTLMIHPGRMRTAMKGSHSNIDPWETAEALMKLLLNIDNLDCKQLFMDYQGVPMDW